MFSAAYRVTGDVGQLTGHVGHSVVANDQWSAMRLR